MLTEKTDNNSKRNHIAVTVLAGMFIFMLVCPFNIFSATPVKPVIPPRRPAATRTAEYPDSILLGQPVTTPSVVVVDSISTNGGELTATPADTLAVVIPENFIADAEAAEIEREEQKYIFNPDATRAVWLSALCPGLGQLYNRRYWKLPIVIGGFMGLGYATSWNNGMLRDYSRAYADIMDNDPSTKSYMDFFPPNVKEDDLDKTWLTNTLKARKDYYRRNRDLCIICMVGVYLLAMVDAYVDASLAHFDISPDLSMQVSPALIPDARTRYPGVGLQWALNF